MIDIKGRGGKSGGGGKEDPNTLQNKAKLRFLGLISEGPVEGFISTDPAQDILINNIPLKDSAGNLNYEGVSYTYRSGLPDQEHIPGFTSGSSLVSLGDTRVTVASPYTFTVSGNVDAAVVTIAIPALFDSRADKGLKKTTLSFNIQVKTATGSYVTVHNKTYFNEKTVSRYEEDFRVNLPAGGSPWSIKITRITPDAAPVDETKLQNQLLAVRYQPIVDGKFSYRNRAILATEIDAELFGNNQPNFKVRHKGIKCWVPKNYNPITRTYATSGAGTTSGTWDGTFKSAWTNNPAWILFDLITNNRYGLGSQFWKLTSGSQLTNGPTDALVDKWQLYVISQYCDVMVNNGFGGTEPRYTLNAHITNKQDAFNLLSSIVATFRGMLYYAGGQVVFTIDKDDSASFEFTQANVIDGLFTYSSSSQKVLNSIAAVRWRDPLNFGREEVEIYEDYDLIYSIGQKIIEVNAFGCTSRGLARRIAKWTLLTEKLQGEVVTFSTGQEGAAVFPGAIINVYDPYKSGVRAGGRIVSVTPGATTAFTVDEYTIFPTGQAATLTYINTSGVPVTKTISASDAGAKTYSVAENITDALGDGSVFAIAWNTLRPQKYRVIATAENTEEKTYSITAIKHESGKYALIEQGISFETPQTSLVSALKPTAPATLTINKWYTEVLGSESESRVTFSWDLVKDGQNYDYELQIETTTEPYTVAYFGKNNTFTTEKLITTTTTEYRAKVRTVDSFGRSSLWTESALFSVAGDEVAPPAPVPNTSRSTGRVVELVWQNPDITDYKHTEVYVNTTNNPATATLVATSNGTSYTYANTNLSTKYFWFKTVTNSLVNNTSLVSTSVSYTPTDPTVGSLEWANITGAGKPADNATRNVVTTGLLANRPVGSNGDLYYATDDNNGAGLLYTKVNGAWVSDPKAKVLFDNLTTTVNNNEATNSSFRSSQATTNTSTATRLTTLESTVDNGTTGLVATRARLITEESTRATADAALSNRATTLEAQMNNTTSSALQSRIATEETTRASADTTLASRSTTLESQMANTAASGLQSRISTEETTRANADSTLSTRATTLESTVNNGTTGVAATAARLTTEEATRASADTALAGRATTLEAQMNNTTSSALQSRIATEETTRANADSTLATRATTLESQIANTASSGLQSRISTEETTRASADTALASRSTTLESQMANTASSGLQSRISTEESTRASADSALATRATTLEAQMANTASSGIQSRIATEESARASGDAALATRSSTLESAYRFPLPEAVNKNPTFGSWTSTLPDDWINWGNATANLTKETGTISPFAYRHGNPAGAAEYGISQDLASKLTLGWYVLECQVTLNSGTFVGAGSHVNFGVSTVTNSTTIVFATDEDITGTAPGNGVVGRRYSFSKLFNITVVPNVANIYVMTNWTGIAGSGNAKNITWHKCLVRPASQGEIDAKISKDVTMPVTVARIATEETTRAAADTALASRSTTLEAQMANTSGSGLQSRIATEESARASADSALATRATTLEAQMANTSASGLQSRISTEESARASGDATNASSITTLSSRVNANPNLFSYPTPIANRTPTQLGWFGTPISSIYASFVGGLVYYRSRPSGGSAMNEAYQIDLPELFNINSGSYTLSCYGYAGSGTIGDRVYAFLDFRSADNSTSLFSSSGVTLNSSAGTRQSITATYTGGVASGRIRIIFIREWPSSGSYQDVVFNMIKLEAGTVATAFTNSAQVQQISSTSIDAYGRAYAISGIQTEVNGRKGGFVMDNNGNVTSFQITADDFRIYQSVGGSNTIPFRVVGGQTQINDALIRTLNVVPDGGGPSHRVQLRPNSYTGADGATFTFSPAYGGIPLVRPVILQPPALAAGETYDISATSLSASGFTIRAKKFSAGTPTAQSTGGGSNVGGTPAWQVSKPTSADGDGNSYTYTWTATIPRISNEFAGGSNWYAEYYGEFDIYYNAGGGWVYAYTTNLAYEGFYSGSSPTSLSGQVGSSTAVLPAIGQHGGNEFGIHAVSGTITAFSGVSYTTTSQSSVVTLPGNFTFDVFAPT